MTQTMVITSQEIHLVHLVTLLPPRKLLRLSVKLLGFGALQHGKMLAAQIKLFLLSLDRVVEH